MTKIPPPREQARILAVLAEAHAPDWNAVERDRVVLYSVYSKDLIERLGRIFAHPDRTDSNGYLIVSVGGRSSGFVTCTFPEENTLEIEATPGVYPPAAGVPATPFRSTLTERLEKKGFRKKADGRFILALDITDTPDRSAWGGASIAIIDPLVDVFAARANSKIEIFAPLAPERDDAEIRRHLNPGAASGQTRQINFEEIFGKLKLEFPEITDELLQTAPAYLLDAPPNEIAKGVLCALHMHDLQDRFARIYAAASSSEDRYLLVSLLDLPGGGVRAWFDDEAKQLVVTPLTEGDKGHFALRLKHSMRPEDFEEATFAIMELMVEVFGATAKSKLQITAPLAPQIDEQAVMALMIRSSRGDVIEN